MTLPFLHNWVYSAIAHNSWCCCASPHRVTHSYSNTQNENRIGIELRKDSLGISLLACLLQNSTSDYSDLNELTRNHSETDTRHERWERSQLWQMLQELGLSHMLYKTKGPRAPELAVHDPGFLPAADAHRDQRDGWTQITAKLPRLRLHLNLGS